MPTSVSASPMSIVCVPGDSMQARAIHALRSVSPMPTSPSSVITSTTIVSCDELVAPGSYPGSSSTCVLTSTTFTSDAAVATIDGDVCARHEARLVRAQEHARVRDLADATEAPNRMLDEEAGLHLGAAIH